MRRSLLLVCAAACGGGGGNPENPSDAPSDSPASNCQAIPAQGAFIRRAGNPRLTAGAVGADNLLDIRIGDPDVGFDAAAGRFLLYFTAERAATYTENPGVPVIRRATSADRMTWTVDADPVLATSASAWDRVFVGRPTVIEHPAAPADRRFLMLYAGAAGAFPHAGASGLDTQIGAAFSADGITFTRVSAAASPHGEDGLVITGAQAYPGAVDALVDDPELALVDGIYHAWFSSLACGDAACQAPSARGIAHATSTDGITWSIDQAPVRSLLRSSADTASGGRAPSVVYDAVHCRFELWQTNDQAGDVATQPAALDNTAGVWKAESTDGASWNVFFAGARDVAWNPAAPADGEHLGVRTGGDVALSAGGRLMILNGLDDRDVPAGFTVPDRQGGAARSGVTTFNVATRDLP